MTIHPHLASPPYWPELVPLPGAASERQIRVLRIVRKLCDLKHASPTRREIAERLGMNRRDVGPGFGWVAGEIDALVTLGFVRLVAYTNCRGWAITPIGRSFVARHDPRPETPRP